MKVPAEEKRKSLMNVALHLFVQQGFYGTPMSQISKFSDMSMGSIYHHFKNKEDIINALYIEIKKNLAAHVLDDCNAKESFAESFHQLLRNVFEFFVENPSDLFFLEQYENSPLITASTREEELLIIRPIEELFDQATAQDLLKDLPSGVLYALFIGSVVSLIKHHLAGRYQLDENLLSVTTRAIWDLIRR